MASDTELKATIARRESEIAERLATIAMLREKLATTEADLAGLAAMRENRIDDVPTAELGDYLTRLRTLESDAAALRKVKKEIERRLSAENNAHSQAAQDMARKRALLAAQSHKESLLAAMASMTAALDDLAEDAAVRSGPNGLVSEALGMRERIKDLSTKIGESW